MLCLIAMMIMTTEKEQVKVKKEKFENTANPDDMTAANSMDTLLDL